MAILNFNDYINEKTSGGPRRPSPPPYKPAQKILDNGESLGDWPIDKDSESNAGVEHLVAYNGKYFYVHTDFKGNAFAVVDVDYAGFDPDDHVRKLIDKHKA